MTSKQKIEYSQKALQYLERAGIVITEKEKDQLEIADFGLDDFENIGVSIITYINTERYCAKELILLPWQICPEHRHPEIDERNIGKQETFRCRMGEVYLYIPGEATRHPKAKVPEKYKKCFTALHEIILKPGDQYTLPPDTLHWFQAGEAGCVVSEFSSKSIDEADVFTDSNIKRVPD